MSNKKFGGANGKGYYIALALCAIAIGVSGYLYYSYANDETMQDNGPDVTAAVTVPVEEKDLPVVATPQSTETIHSDNATMPQSTVAEKTLQTAYPLEGQTVAVYAMDTLGYNATTRDWRTHNGVDIAAEEGTAVCAAAAGTVYTVYEDETMGMTVVLRHINGYVTKYASLAEEVSVKPGDTVELGQKLGCVGSTALLESAIGDHVHFSVTHNDVPMDPAEFLNQD